MNNAAVDGEKGSRRILYVSGGLFLSLYLLWLVWGRGDPWERYWLGALTTLSTSLAAALFAHWKARRSSGWLWLAAGLSLWAAVDLLRMLALLIDPDLLYRLNVLDILYMLGVLALAVGLVKLPRSPRERIGRTRLILDVLITTTASLALVYLLVLQPWLAQSPSAGNPAALAYPLGDLALFLVLINLFLFSQPARGGTPFGFLFAAILAYTLSDMMYANLLARSAYLPGGPADFGWVLGNLMMVSAALARTRLRLQWSPRAARLLERGLIRLQSMLPLLSVLVLSWFVILDWRLNEGFNPLALWITLILTIGIIARQGILTGEVEFEQYANLVNSVAEPAFVCDNRGRFRLVNPAFIQAAGYLQPRELLGRSLDELLEPPDGLSSLPLPDSGNAWNSETGWSGETVLRCKDGSLLPVYLSLRPAGGLSAAGGRDRFALAGTAHDLSLQKQQQAALQAAYEQIARDHAELELLNTQLEQRVSEKTADLSAAYARLEAQNQALLQVDRLKSDFVSLVSHELRAPLTNIKSGIELLARGSTAREHQDRIIALVQAEIERLTRFIESILDISALDAGRMPLYPAPVSLGAVARQLQAQAAHLPVAGRVTWHIPADMPQVLADEQALTSALFHLLDNAFKYAPDSPVTVSAGASGERAWIKVSDRGPGLPEETLPFLFERFYRPDSADNREVYGHGLGLYLVRRLLEAMQGEVSAENQPEGGACFTCWLPLVGEIEEWEETSHEQDSGRG